MIIFLHSFGLKAQTFPVDYLDLAVGFLLHILLPNMVAGEGFVRVPASFSGLEECSKERILQR